MALPLQRPIKVRHLMRRRLTELKRTPAELADAMQVPVTYVTDLLAGRRAPPAPGRSEVYGRMTKFLRLHRNDLPSCARAEWDAREATPRRPAAAVRTRLLELCDPARARTVQRRLAVRGGGVGVALEILIADRLLEVSKGFVRRQLDDEAGIRIAASREGCDYAQMRMRLIDFLETTADTLTVEDFENFVRPRIGTWAVDLDTGTMRIVLRSQDPEPRQRRALKV